VFPNENGVGQITGFDVDMKVDIGGFSGERWTPKADIQPSTRILSESVVGTSAEQGCGRSGIPSFVDTMIERGEYADWKAVESFPEILNILKRQLTQSTRKLFGIADRS
jgi:hypothetical protein